MAAISVSQFACFVGVMATVTEDIAALNSWLPHSIGYEESRRGRPRGLRQPEDRKFVAQERFDSKANTARHNNQIAISAEPLVPERESKSQPAL